MAGLDCEALALLVVRLGSGEPADGELCWHRWQEAPGAERHGLPGEIGPSSGWEEPFKHLPGEDTLPYFNAHVERLLFPTGSGRGARWSCCPDRLNVDLTGKAGEPGRRARVDLLERLTTPLDPGSTFGLIHLSLLPTEEPDAPDTLWWRWAIASPFLRNRALSEFALDSAGERVDLDCRRPVRALTEQLFGDPDRYLERSFYTVLMAKCPAGVDEGEWRRELAVPARSHASDELAEERENRQTVWLAQTPGLLLGRSAVFTAADPITVPKARNLRSYWTESIVLGLLQQDCLEEFQRRLASVGDLLDRDVKELRRDWLEFRNVLWWSQLSSSSEIPQQLVSRLRSELGTSSLFTELEEDLAVYSDYQHQVFEEGQTRALANLQIYGSAIVVLGTLLTAIGLFAATGVQRAILVGASVLVAAAILQLVPVLLRRQVDAPADPASG